MAYILCVQRAYSPLGENGHAQYKTIFVYCLNCVKVEWGVLQKQRDELAEVLLIKRMWES